MYHVLAIAGNDLSLPFVSIIDTGKVTVELHLTHNVNGIKKTEVLSLWREELDLIAEAILRAKGWTKIPD